MMHTEANTKFTAEIDNIYKSFIDFPTQDATSYPKKCVTVVMEVIFIKTALDQISKR